MSLTIICNIHGRNKDSLTIFIKGSKSMPDAEAFSSIKTEKQKYPGVPVSHVKGRLSVFGQE